MPRLARWSCRLCNARGLGNGYTAAVDAWRDHYRTEHYRKDT